MDSLTRASRSRGGLDETTLDLIDRVGVSESDADGLVREVLTTTLAVLPCQHPLLLLQTDDGRPRLYTALDDGAVIGMPYAESATLLAELLSAGQPEVIEDVGSRPDAGEVLTRMFQASVLAIAPLRAGTRTIGLVGVVDPSTPAPERDLNVIQLLAARAAVAFNAVRARARLRDEVRDSEFLLQKLYGSDQNKTELLSVVSHEVKGPVTNIIGFGQALRTEWESVQPAKRAHFLDVIVREGQRAARLIEDVLDLARLESGSFGCDLRPSALMDIVGDVLAVNKAACESHDISVDLPDTLPLVAADPDRLGQVLRNLVSNACRYAPPGSKVTIRAAMISDGEAPKVLVSVTDEGPGIPEEEQAQLFDKFTRLSTSQGAEKGAGIGLYISRGIVEAHGGEIWVKSRPNEGTTFFFTLLPSG